MRVLERYLASTAFAGMILVLPFCIAPALLAADSDLSTTITAPEEARLGQVIPITVGYANAGPDAAGSAYINAYIPSGVPAPIDELTQAQRDAIQASALGTDTLGNEAFLFDEERYCEGVYLQLQRDDDDGDANPVEGLDPGVSASFGFELPIPLEPPRFGRVTITEPASLAQSWRPVQTDQDQRQAAGHNLYMPGVCMKLVGTIDESVCDHSFDNCFGERISLMDPVEAEFELVNDGSANPTLGCEEFDSFTAGNIAVIRRGDCEFYVKAFNAEQVGAIAAVIVNHDGCRDEPDSDQCVIEMYEGLGAPVTIPPVMLAKADGEPIIAALEAGTTVRGIIGPQEDDLILESFAFLTDENDLDPNPDNDQARAEIHVDPCPPPPPAAAFTYSPEPPTVSSPIQFTDTSTFIPPNIWAWDFGDGAGTSTEQHPTYTFGAEGVYTVSLTVSNSSGSDTATRELTVHRAGVRRQSGGRLRPDGN